MGENSSIEWCDHTFNPWTRCTKVSPACDFCYAETWAKRAKHPIGLPLWGSEAPRDPTSAHNWRQPVRWNRQAMEDGVRRRVFCASLADVFEEHPAVLKSGARDRLWDLIEATPALDWMLLTKRPENMNAMAPKSWVHGWPKNVWAGTTVENQEWADRRLPHLLDVPAAVRFLSAEPLLGPIDLDLPHCQHCYPLETEEIVDCEDGTPWCNNCDSEACFGMWLDPCADEDQAGINLVIVGGESGHHARPTHLSWVRAMRDQCVQASVSFHFKQHGEWAPRDYMDPTATHAIRSDTGHVVELARGLERTSADLIWQAVAKVGKPSAGRLLDGRTWDQFPEVER